METPLTYIPIDRRLALAQGRALPERARGAALFADISGFTPLTEMLARLLGPKRGAEELTVYLNQVYDALITELHRYGGSALVFSGDAITCWFDENDETGQRRSPDEAAPTLRATASALAMQAIMARFANMQVPGGGLVSLAMKAAVVAGPVRRFVIGDPEYTLIDVMAGATLERLTEAEHQAAKGEVVVDADTLTLLAHQAQIIEWRADENTGARFAVVTGLTAPVAETPWPTLPVEALSDEQVRAWLLPPVYRRLRAGRGEYLAELRPAAALFLRFTGLDYDHDPAAPDRLNAFIQKVEHIMLRYDGSLLQVTIGDKGSYLYAAFGTPVAHEDDVDRAASAALDLHTLPAQFDFLAPLQIGLTHGRLRVGAYGGAQRRTYGALGDAVNLAARLMQAAEPGQTLVSEVARAQASDHFIWESLPPIRVKGKSEPVAVHRLVRAQKRNVGVALDVLFPLPPLGRETILSRLSNSLTAVLGGQGQVVRLVGEAGMGKSHLAAHFTREVVARGARLALGVCQSITQSAAYAPWRQVFFALFDLENSTEDEAVVRLTHLVTNDHPEWAVRLPLLSDLLGLPFPDNATTAALTSDQRQKALFSLLVEVVQWCAQSQPVMLLIENAQWMDEASLALTQTLAQQATRTAPACLLLTHRPPLLGEAPLLPRLADLPNYVELPLNEMDEGELTALIARQLKGAPSPLLRALVGRLARGNPFYVGELLEAMQAGRQLTWDEYETWEISGDLLNVLRAADFVMPVEDRWQLRADADLATIKLGIPDSIHGLILSRLDRLPESHKLTLKVSSVVGYSIDLALVARAHPDEKDLPAIQAEAAYMEDEALIREELPVDQIYAFRHQTTQEVAYETLLYTQRQQLHRSVAQVLAAQHPEATSTIAHHAFLGQVWPLALQYNLLGGEQTQHLHANHQSIDFFHKALQSARELPEADTAEQRKRIHLALGDLLVATGQHALAAEHLETAITLAQTQGDAESEARACRLMGHSFELRGELAPALEWMERGFAALGERLVSETGELCIVAGLINNRLGQFEQARALCERSLRVGQTLDDAALRARTYNLLGAIEMRQNSAAAIERLQQSLAQYEQLGNIYGQAISHNLIANGHFGLSEWARADTHYRRSLDLFTQTGNVYNQVLVRNNLGGIALKQGRWDAALGYYQRAVHLLEQTGGSLWIFGALHLNIGHVHLRRGELDLASGELRRAEELFDRAKMRELLPELFGLLAETAWRAGDIAAAERDGQHALALAREMTAPRDEGHALRLLGEMAQARGEPELARQQLEAGLAILKQAGDEYESAQAQLALARWHAAQEQTEPARALALECETIFTRLGAQADQHEAEQVRLNLG